jgi:hypothetical protein
MSPMDFVNEVTEKSMQIVSSMISSVQECKNDDPFVRIFYVNYSLKAKI